jgi:hypothetical protein
MKDLKRYALLAVAWDRHGSPVPRWTLTCYGLDKTFTLLALQSTGYPQPPRRRRRWPFFTGRSHRVFRINPTHNQN